MSTKKTVLAAMMALSFLPVGSALAAEEAEVDDSPLTYKIDEMTCREMLVMRGEARDFTMIFMHGFMSGKKSELLFDPVPLTEATDMVINNCIDNPDGKLLAMFEKARK